MVLRVRWVVPLVAALLALAGIGGAAPAHPLDPLTPDEIRAAVGALRQARLVDRTTSFALIELAEPDKPTVLAWQPGHPVQRKAVVVARAAGTLYEGVVDLGGRAVERWQAMPGVQSPLLAEEWRRAVDIAMTDPGWQQAMAKRGYASLAGIFCAPLAAGVVAPDEIGRRLARVTCFDKLGTGNIRARPIEGLVATVDLDAATVIRLLDTGVVPVSRTPADFGMRPMRRQKPAARGGERFAIDGHVVRWRGWSFHYRLDRRTGAILSLVRHQDQGRQRLVLYRGSLAELFVPYMDPAPAWAFRAWLDVGEQGFGWLASPLVRGIDCPADAAMLDAVLADDRGQPLVARSVICLFERATGAPLWRHAESASHAYAGRPVHELVLRTIPSVGTYDYIIDWVLTEAGTIRIDVGATGIDAAKGVATRTMAAPSAPADTAHGMLVAPNLVAVYHDHFLSFRLDLDIDGTANTLLRQRLVPQPARGASGRAVWTVTETPVTAEGALGRAAHVGEAHGGDAHGAELWRVVNPTLTTRLGQHPGYEVRLGHSATSLLPGDDPAARRGAFAAAPLWVSAYDPEELYAAGTYPNGSPGGDGLPAFVAKHRPVENADIVLWCTLGFHHLTRPEDWPVLPTVWHSLELVPFGFFDRNPSLPAERDR